MATCTALTNVVGNKVVTFAIAKWEKSFDKERFDAYLADQTTGLIAPSGTDEHLPDRQRAAAE
jgi:aerobic C4-dicarboxylate transport protein